MTAGASTFRQNSWAQTIEKSWSARRDAVPTLYHIYLKMAYHLSHEARQGLSEYRIPRDIAAKLLKFQEAAVKIAAHHLDKRGGVLIGDVVGLGKTLMATAVARVFEHDYDPLIICPKHLVPMWEDYRAQYRLAGRVLSLSQAARVLPDLRIYRLVLIDESHNLRNREGKRYHAIQEYIRENDSKVILLSATPYNKTYVDLSNQLRLFISEDHDLGDPAPKEIAQTNRPRRHGAVAVFTQVDCRLRREPVCGRLARADAPLYGPPHAQLYSGKLFRSRPRNRAPVRALHRWTPEMLLSVWREPRTVRFPIDERDPQDQYARLFSPAVEKTVNRLSLPRYGLGNYIHPTPHEPPTTAEAKIIADLSRAGKRLTGFCRTGLFKRLESSGHAFLQSLERHILRNCVYLHAIERGLPVPIGSCRTPQYCSTCSVSDGVDEPFALEDDDDGDEDANGARAAPPRTLPEFQARAAAVYATYAGPMQRRFKWLPANLFIDELNSDLRADNHALLTILQQSGDWRPERDAKLTELESLIRTALSASQKILIFSQFADTVEYVAGQLKSPRGLVAIGRRHRRHG